MNEQGHRSSLCSESNGTAGTPGVRKEPGGLEMASEQVQRGTQKLEVKPEAGWGRYSLSLFRLRIEENNNHINNYPIIAADYLCQGLNELIHMQGLEQCLTPLEKLSVHIKFYWF